MKQTITPQPFPHFIDYAIAYRFAWIIASWLTEDQLAEVNRVNRESPDSQRFCHSHEFCDPNQAMIDAIEELGLAFKPQSAEQQALIDEAWTIAREAGFSIEAIDRKVKP